jgi:poly-gamma-glutamate capsule biosynthesis protein CapA/YwtB (metallophosphatase superfamily)
VRATRLSILLGLVLAAGALVALAPSRTPAASQNGVTIAGAGDIALLGPPPRPIFSRVRGPLRQADLAIGNLEGTLGSGGSSKCSAGSTSCFAFQSPASSARLLRAAGFDDLNVANNHAFDFGASGQRQTLAALSARRLRWSGRPRQITVARVKGLRIAILGFAPYPWAQSLLNIPAARKLARRAAERADLVVAMLHAGAEGTAYQHVPHGSEYYLGENRGNERRFAHALVGAGVDLVLASGPHVLRGLELYHGHLIAYSLGNFATCSHALSMGGVLGEGAILDATLDESGNLLSGRVLPVRLSDSGPSRMYGRNDVIPRLNSLSRQDFRGTAVLLDGNGAFQLG